MTVSFKSCWYRTFFLKTKTRLSLNSTSGLPHPRQSLPVSKKWSKRSEREWGRETGGQAGLFLALRSFLNFSFILPVHSVLLSIAPVTRLSIHCLILPPLPPPSISLTHPDPIPSLLTSLSNSWGPALATIHQPDGPPLTGLPPPNSPPAPLQNTLTHICTQQPGHSPPYALYQAAAMLIGRKGWREGEMRRRDRAASL